MTRKLTVEQIRDIVEQRGGVLRSTEYNNVSTPLTIECNNGHVWVSSYDSLRKNCWCPHCSGKSPLTIGVAKDVAKKRGGKVISSTYTNNKAPIEWECNFGHRWKASLSDVKNGGKWCPECSSGLYERICRKYFECLFQNNFPKVRPKWLVNTSGNRMELDGYCRTIGVAFEHNGLQHYKPTYMGDTRQLIKRKQLDKEKRAICEKMGVFLIEIPQLVTQTPISSLHSFIIEQCYLKNIRVPNIDGTPDLSEIYTSKLTQYHELAKSYGGECLSNVYLGSTHKLLWKCSNGHVWKDTPSNIKHRKKWCLKCNSIKERNNKLIELQKIAYARGGKCLSTSFIRSDVKMRWSCAKGHEWDALPSNVKRGNWCQRCHLERCRDV